jgi:branched-chain amino acid transport system ATP-binding protein
MSDSGLILQLEGVGKRFGNSEVLREVSLSVARGERVALIGPNGAGKSTLFNLISGRERPSSGRISFNGRRIDGLSPQQISRLGLGRSFQVSHLFPRLSASDNLRCAMLWSSGQRYSFWRRLASLRELNSQAGLLLERLGLSGRRDTPAGELSYAEQRALELGVTVAGGAELVLLDEPTAGMSRSETARCVELIRELCAGRTLLMVEHDMGVVFELADRIAVLAQGRLIAFGLPAQVRADPLVRQAYLGSLPSSELDHG